MRCRAGRVDRGDWGRIPLMHQPGEGWTLQRVCYDASGRALGRVRWVEGSP